MKTTRPGRVKYPRLYETFKNTKQIADVINRSPAYVKKALNVGFTARERAMLESFAGKELFCGEA